MTKGQTVGVLATSSSESAGILALLSHTRHVQWTVIVSTTSCKAFSLNAKLSYSTFCVSRTFTSLNTSVVQAELLRRAVSISGAADLFLWLQPATNRRVAFVVSWTRADWLMIDRLTVSSFSANIRKHARVDALQTDATFTIRAVAVCTTTRLALVVLADLSSWTVYIDDALHVLAANARISGVLDWTRAEGLMVDGIADSTSATGSWTRAYVHAFPVDTSVRRGTLGLRATSAHALTTLTN